ncbi:Putative transcriptional regulator, LytR-family [Corynebacterium glyciniphilum AJ 3170]|uniref:Putative transcriptional regulator, LytR-family n=1 Tax=Corynebacterium glyciniphilum AJ 3170 TaxID=1404245 RepID=X5DQ03_9CORY|nr:Putative transcriptional regulator, LytR-family [Corynebacterium glyciniphilum AJ 3170]
MLALLSAIMLAGGTYAYSSVGRLDSNLNQAGGLNLGSQSDGATDILLVGIDSRTNAHGEALSQDDIDMLRAGEEETTSTDTIILIRIPDDGSSATAVSLPRDTYVDGGSELGNQKINSIYGQTKFYKTQELQDESAAAGETPDEKKIENESSQAGREALVSSVADVTGITVDHYAEVGLLGFVKLTNAVGGVDVCLNNAVDEPLSGAKFPAGEQTLSGQDALSFVRQRHELPRGDLDRITRQQVYMASLANKVLSTSTLTNPSSLGKLRSAIEDSVVLDEGWDVMGLATQMQNLAGGNVTFQTIPVTSIDGTGDQGESVVTIDKKQVHSFFENLLGDGDSEDKDGSSDDSDNTDSSSDIEDYEPSESTVSVYNASQIGGLASRVGDLISGAGYGMGEVGNATETGISESQVNVADTDDPAARGLAEQLGGLSVVEDSSLEPGEIRVTLSGTYDGPGTSTSGIDEPLPAVGESGSGSSGDSSENVGTPGTDATGGDVLGENENADGASGESGDDVGAVGTSEESDSATTDRGAIDAGGDGPMCIN